MVRIDGRAFDEVRDVSISLGVQPYAEGSVQIESGSTSVVCAVSVNDGGPPFMQGTGTGWVTAEYGMLPRATHTRNQREGRGKGLKGRTQEIQRLIGRSLRAAVDLSNLGERTLMVDCDVLQADGGTRTAAITGSYVALQQAVKTLINRGDLSSSPFTSAIASISVGIIDGEILLDLNYEEDSNADADFNIVMTDAGEFVEIQGTAEGVTFSRDALGKVLEVAEKGIRELFEDQASVIQDLN